MEISIVGATGSIGQHLVPRLLKAGHTVRALCRSPGRARALPWGDRIRIDQGDLARPETLLGAFEGVDAVYYLVHAMAEDGDFAATDRAWAQAFVRAARGVPKVIYLGGLLPQGDASTHLRSRAEVGAILRGGLPTTELRAGPILGEGSASFEIARALTEHLPILPIPPWGRLSVSPIALSDALDYLVAALDAPALGALDIGGAPLSFEDLLREIARSRGLRRRFVPIPDLPHPLLSRAVGALTPVPGAISAPLLQGARQALVADTARARARFPGIVPLPIADAVDQALLSLSAPPDTLRWRAQGEEKGRTWQLEDQAGLLREVASTPLDLAPEAAFAAISQLGGRPEEGGGWPAFGWAWRLRGGVEGALTGRALEPRRPAGALSLGDRIDAWEVVALEPGRLLRLRSLTALPGRAWLQLETVPEGQGCRLVQSTLFAPKGLAGLAYWWGLFPAHRVVFGAMLEGFEAWAKVGGPAPARRPTRGPLGSSPLRAVLS